MNLPRTLTVEGWRGLPHSYSIVNQFQCLQFLREPNLMLAHRDIPFHVNWSRIRGLLSPAAEDAIAKIPVPADGECPDAVYRISYPYRIGPSAGKRTAVFATAEYQWVPDQYLADGRSLASACSECNAVIVTPSNWSRTGFILSGAPPERVRVVPHAVDPSIFHPVSLEHRQTLRAHMRWSGFVFLSLGAMTDNKGIGLLLKALAIVAQKHPRVCLVLKGLGALYTSRDMFLRHGSMLTQAERALLQPRIKYLENTFSFEVMAELYQAADAYVSPYSAEGFNLPVLEAIACGLPVICTRGGSTDDFTSDDFALRIDSVRTPSPPGVFKGGHFLQVNFEHLVHQMMRAVETPEVAANVLLKGPAFVANGYTWPQVTQLLLDVLFG